jgi:putative ABC transport system permease protein
MPEVELITSQYSIPGQSYVAYKGKSVKYQVVSVHPDYACINKEEIIKGRNFNENDISEKRKVVAITQEVEEELFGRNNSIGEYIIINGFYARVVAVFKSKDQNSDNKVIVLPITTAQLLYGGTKRVSNMAFTIPVSSSVERSREIEQSVRNQIAKIHKFDPEDNRAIHISNSIERLSRMMTLFESIRLFVWVIGVMTIVAGIVGVSNIMTIVVKERTREIGIRKAIGARPISIIGMIMQEAVLITSASGFIGLLAGTGLLEFLRRVMPKNDYFYNPEASMTIAVSATILLIVAGLLAGFFPARKAAKIKPIVALRDE